MKRLLIISMLLISINAFTQTITRYSVQCFEGKVIKNDITWVDSYECTKYKIKIKDKVIKLKAGLRTQRFKILEYSGFAVEKDYVRNTWKCFDTRSNEYCFIYHVVAPEDLPIEEFYIEYTDQAYCFKVVRKTLK